MKVLGIHIGHDSSAALVVDGKIIADVAEERFCRIKHYSGLPISSIEYCLKKGKLSIRDIDFVAIPTKGSLPDLNYLLDLMGTRAEKKNSYSGKILEFVKMITKRAVDKPPIYIKNFPISDKTEIVRVEHHLAHAASAYYTCGSTEKQLIVTMDGLGNNVSVAIWRGQRGRIEPLLKIGREGSIAWFYGIVTEALGWRHGDGEGKTMGLAPYGNYIKAKGELDKFYPKFENGNLIKGHDFGRAFFWKEGGAFQWHFDEAYQIRRIIKKNGREHIAAEAQRILEEQVFEIIFPWMERENTQNLCCSGGIFLNVKLNQRIWETGKVKNQHIFPNAGDSGLAVGAAL